VPGPGKYPVTPSINRSGKYYNSKYSNSLAKVWDPQTSRRKMTYLQSTVYSPGPGKHSMKASEISRTGVYHCSKFKNSLSRQFGKEKRNPLGLRPSCKVKVCL